MTKIHPLAPQSRRAFTLVEMLVVIAIIAILAGILLPVLATVKTRAKIAQARLEMQNLEAAIKQYETEYSRPPGFKGAEQASTATHPDFTYGTVNTGFGGAVVLNGNGVDTNNAVIMQILLNKDAGYNAGFTRNPNKVALFTAKEVDGTARSGVDPNHVFRDPWGNPYIITIDMNDDNKARDGFYRNVGGAGFTGNAGALELSRAVMIWSFGPDGSADSTAGPKNGANKDNVLSWE